MDTHTHTHIHTHTHTRNERLLLRAQDSLDMEAPPRSAASVRSTTSCIPSETLGEPYLDLFIRGYRAENNLCEALGRKHPEADTANDTAIFN